MLNGPIHQALGGQVFIIRNRRYEPQLSNTLDGIFCLDALRRVLSKGRPKISNTDQGAQFTVDAFTTCLLAANIQVSMDGRGRALGNVFCERL